MNKYLYTVAPHQYRRIDAYDYDDAGRQLNEVGMIDHEIVAGHRKREMRIPGFLGLWRRVKNAIRNERTQKYYYTLPPNRQRYISASDIDDASGLLRAAGVRNFKIEIGE